MEKLFHRDIGFPPGFKRPVNLIMVAYSEHAMRAAKDDRYGEIPLPSRIRLSDFEPVEIAMDERRVTKYVMRGELDETRDWVIVLNPRGSRPWLARTVWINERDDNHGTLDESRYERT